MSAVCSIDLENGLRVTSRTPVGKHCWRFSQEGVMRKKVVNVTSWLRKIASKPRKTVREESGIKGTVDDPFEVCGIQCCSCSLKIERCRGKLKVT